jgi:hypothetical protein
MSDFREQPVQVACFGCGKTQRVRPSKITPCDAYLCNSSQCASLMPEPPEGFLRKFQYEAAGGFGGYIIRPATEEEQLSIRRAKDIAASVVEVTSAEYVTKRELRERGWTGWLFKRLLPEPDVVRRDPALPRKVHEFYRRDRVERAETMPEWRQVEMEMLAQKEREAQWRRWRQGQFLGSQDWMNCNEPEGMLSFLARCDRRDGRADSLLVCALARDVLCSYHADLLEDELKVAERHADEQATFDEYMAAYGSALRKIEEEFEADAGKDEYPFGGWPDDKCCATEYILHLAFEELLDDGRLLDMADPQSAARLIREVYGNPFATATLDRSWLRPEVVALARSIYDERSFDRMPELAAALERAGCDHQELLGHCRQSQAHVLGCWALDCILGPGPGPAVHRTEAAAIMALPAEQVAPGGPA